MAEQMLSVPQQYVINLDSARVHRRTQDSSGEWRDYPRCNLDQIIRKKIVETREDVVDALAGRKPRGCQRCFPGPTEDQIAEDKAVPIGEAAHNPADVASPE